LPTFDGLTMAHLAAWAPYIYAGVMFLVTVVVFGVRQGWVLGRRMLASEYREQAMKDDLESVRQEIRAAHAISERNRIAHEELSRDVLLQTANLTHQAELLTRADEAVRRETEQALAQIKEVLKSQDRRVTKHSDAIEAVRVHGGLPRQPHKPTPRPTHQPVDGLRLPRAGSRPEVTRPKTRRDEND